MNLLGVRVVVVVWMVMHRVVHVAGRWRLIMPLAMPRQMMGTVCWTVRAVCLLLLLLLLQVACIGGRLCCYRRHHLAWGASSEWEVGRRGHLRLTRRTSVRVVIDSAGLRMVRNRDEHLLQGHAPRQVPGAWVVVLHVDRADRTATH